MAIQALRSRRQRRAARIGSLCVALGLLASASAFACTIQHNAGGPVNIVIDAWDDVEQDKLIAYWTQGTGNAQFLLGCTSRSITPMDVTPSLSGLEFVRNVTVDGETYPAFGLIAYPRSPLLIFQHQVWTGDGSIKDDIYPLDIRSPAHFTSKPLDSTGRGSMVQVAAVSRGGIMQPVPSTLLGPISRVSPLYPAFVKTDTFTMTANLKVPTCTLTDTPVTLVDVAAADLPASGRYTGERSFDVAMDCNGAFPVQMVLTDANMPGNTGSRLAPTRNATAGAVRVELLREGAPVVLRQAWTIPLTQMGRQNIRLAARYYREAGTFYGGVVEGQAVITATYR
ncbi:fimbrial protein [Stenotrophomonas maltophilia]|uniref:fimbrial protein n=1 Tax=Stenotrophomonas maltophilia TaxID=40324 RepID=UPI000ACEB795|nr:hypothetical protein [Stenotrophomonas maltophilia]